MLGLNCQPTAGTLEIILIVWGVRQEQAEEGWL